MRLNPGHNCIVGAKSHPQAVLLAMLTMKEETSGFHNFYAWFSSVSPISMGMELRSLALNQYKLQPDELLGSYAGLTFT